MGDALTSKWKQTSYRFLVANALRQLVAVSLTSRPRSDGALLQRLHPRRVAAPRGSRAGPGPARGRSRHAAARKDGARPALFTRSAGLALAVYGGTSLVPRALEEGIAAAAAARPQRVLVNVFLDGGADSLSMLFPPPTRCTGSCDRGWRSPSRTARPSPRTAVSLASVARAARGAARRGQGVRPDRRRLRGPDQSHFTSRHFWEVGATSEQLRTGWLGRYLDRAGSPDNPLRASRSSRAQPALATARMPVASIDGPDRFDFWTRNVWGEVETRMLDALGALGALPTAAILRSRSNRGRAPVGQTATAAAPVQAEEGSAGFTEPGRLSRRRGRRLPAPPGRPRGDAGRGPARSGWSR